MHTNASDALWLDHSQRVTIDDLITLSGLSEKEIVELIDAGALVPADPRAATWTFSAACVVTVRKATRMRGDLELDMHALALTLTLLEQIRVLETELSQLRAQQPSFRNQ